MRRMDSITEYQNEAYKTIKPHKTLTSEQAELLDWTLGLPGEVGEVCELIKHHVFHDEPLDKMKIAKELGDVYWYLAALATKLDIDLDSILALNINKLRHRYQGKKYDVNLSANRHEAELKFEDTDIYQLIKRDILKLNEPYLYNNIILIGPDGSGKTTLAKELVKIIGYQYYKCSYREPDKLERAKNLIKSSNRVVFDRFYYPDEIIYKKVKNEPLDENTIYEFKQLESILLEKDFAFIYVDASLATLIERSKTWTDDYISTLHLGKIKQLYAEFFANTRVPFTIIDTTDDNIKRNLDNILQFLGDTSSNN